MTTIRDGSDNGFPDGKDVYERLLKIQRDAQKLKGVDALSVQLQLDELIESVRQQLIGGSKLTPHENFQNISALDRQLDAFSDAWSAFRRDAGTSVARDLIAAQNLQDSWSHRWKGLYERAWERREGLAQTVQAASESSHGQALRESRAVYKPLQRTAWARSEEALLLALDLRYVVALPLADIADLLAISLGFAHRLISRFEDEVVLRFVLDRVKEEVPAGWDARPIAPAQSDARVIELRSQTQAGRPVSTRPSRVILDILPIWEDSDSPPGRSRHMSASQDRTTSTRTPRMSAIAFLQEPRIVFVPHSALSTENHIDASLTARILMAARHAGFTDLGDALKNTLDRAGEDE